MKASLTDIQAIGSVVNRQNHRSPDRVVRFLECISDLHARYDTDLVADAFDHFEKNALDEGNEYVYSTFNQEDYFVDLIDGTRMMEIVSKSAKWTLAEFVTCVEHFVETPLPMDEVEHAIEYHNDVLHNED